MFVCLINMIVCVELVFCFFLFFVTTVGLNIAPMRYNLFEEPFSENTARLMMNDLRRLIKIKNEKKSTIAERFFISFRFVCNTVPLFIYTVLVRAEKNDLKFKKGFAAAPLCSVPNERRLRFVRVQHNQGNTIQLFIYTYIILKSSRKRVQQRYIMRFIFFPFSTAFVRIQNTRKRQSLSRK